MSRPEIGSPGTYAWRRLFASMYLSIARACLRLKSSHSAQSMGQLIAFPSKPRCVGEGAWRCVVGRFARLRVRAVAYERDRRGRKPDGSALLSAAVRNPPIRRDDMTPRAATPRWRTSPSVDRTLRLQSPNETGSRPLKSRHSIGSRSPCHPVNASFTSR